jgi:hypothetical protein
MDHTPLGNDPLAQQAELRKEFESNQVHFMLTELDTAATFCGVAKSASEPEKIKRNVANARLAYETALKFAGGANFDKDIKHEFDSKRNHVKDLLTELGQQV